VNKIITIFLDAQQYPTGGFLSGKTAHGFAEEHLKDELAAGWSVKSANIACGSSELGAVRGWLVVVLEKA
jgi:hypothetical protein